jgi:hypothetical protein
MVAGRGAKCRISRRCQRHTVRRAARLQQGSRAQRRFRTRKGKPRSGGRRRNLARRRHRRSGNCQETGGKHPARQRDQSLIWQRLIWRRPERIAGGSIIGVIDRRQPLPVGGAIAQPFSLSFTGATISNWASE